MADSTSWWVIFSKPIFLVYLWRNGQLTQLNEDHIFANDLDRDAANGNISREDAENHPERRSLTSYLGLTPLDLIDHNPKSFPLSLEIGCCFAVTASTPHWMKAKSHHSLTTKPSKRQKTWSPSSWRRIAQAKIISPSPCWLASPIRHRLPSPRRKYSYPRSILVGLLGALWLG